ncbi:hypothetical protein BaRGS_00012271 [Batillaria attramentaria]|uniref:Uncharacterized protein n=1 Tax=Batillaria attramentaria TaxID=370345 RepID=A0ABD0LAY8_9CAEN
MLQNGFVDCSVNSEIEVFTTGYHSSTVLLQACLYSDYICYMDTLRIRLLRKQTLFSAGLLVKFATYHLERSYDKCVGTSQPLQDYELCVHAG